MTPDQNFKERQTTFKEIKRCRITENAIESQMKDKKDCTFKPDLSATDGYSLPNEM